jgi:hypothetical protein
MRMFVGMACISIAWASSANVRADGDFRPVRCEGTYTDHLQGVCTNNRDAIYWSFTNALVKTNLDGKIVARKDVASHHGDLCFHKGRINVAVNLGKFNQPAGQADSWVYVYDPESLDELERKAVPELVHGAGGIAFGDGRFIVVGGLPGGFRENYLYEYGEDLSFRKRHVLASGYTLMGIQTVAFVDGQWWFGCYGVPKKLLKADRVFSLVGKWDFDASLGLVGLPDDRLFVARPVRSESKRHGAELKIAVPDEAHGLRVAE